MLVSKGVALSKENICRTGAVVTKLFDEENTVIDVNPTKIIKKTCFIYNVKKYIRISKYRKANKRMDFNIKVRKNKIKLLYESLSFW